LSTRAVAERLTVAVRTVDGHIYKAMAKTGTSSRDELAALLPAHHATRRARSGAPARLKAKFFAARRDVTGRGLTSRAVAAEADNPGQLVAPWVVNSFRVRMRVGGLDSDFRVPA
jgi:hypothetical protein